MITSRFSDSFARLLLRRRAYDDAPRVPERVVDLATARADLDDARSDVADARGEIEWNPSTSSAPPKQTSISEEDLARLRVQIMFPPEG